MKIFRTKFLLFISSVAFILGSCSSVDASAGVKEDHKIDLSEFTAIELSNGGILEFTESETTSIILHSSIEIYDVMEFEVKNSVLSIKSKNGVIITNSKEVLVTITAPNVNSFNCSGSADMSITNSTRNPISNYSLSVSGSGSINANYINAKRLQLDVSGSGEIAVDNVNAENSEINISGSGEISIISGATNYTNLMLNGSGDYNASDFISKHATVNVSGSGEAHLTAETTLQGTISGSGSITYKGNPIIDIIESGSGDLIQGH